jgi:purine-binding chemotaxis protein CheW
MRMSIKHPNPFALGDSAHQNSIFAVRGNLDGAQTVSDFNDLKQYIGLIVAGNEFLMPVAVVNEIIMMNHITYVPNSPQYIEGVINLRGKIVPALSLRNVIGYENAAPTSASRIIITSFENCMIGLIVDGITYVISLTSEQIDAQSVLFNGHGAELINGIAKRGNQVTGILDIGKIGSAFNAILADSDQIKTA